MAHNLDTSIHSMINWMRVFSALSIEAFNEVYELLDFPFSVPSNLRQVAHDFILTYTILHQNPEYATAIATLLSSGESASINLLMNVSEQAVYAEKRDALLNNTFMQLENMGFANAVFTWGLQTYTYHKYKDKHKLEEIRTLESLFHLLRRWAVNEYLNSSTATATENDIAMLIRKYASIYSENVQVNTSNQQFQNLALSSASQAKLQELTLYHEAQKLRLDNTLDGIMMNPRTAWEDFALRTCGAATWMGLEGCHRINWRAWQSILAILNAEEIGMIEQYLMQQQSLKPANLKLRLPPY